MNTPQAFPAPLPTDTTPFEELPPECWTDELLQASELVGAVVEQRALAIVSELGLGGEAVVQERRRAFEWLLGYLRWRGLLRGEQLRDRASWSPAELARAAEALAEYAAPALALVERAFEHYPAFLRGEKLGSQILFGAETLPLWETYFSNDNLMNLAVNAQTACAADVATHGREGLRVLEVGGGCGSSGTRLLQTLGGRVASYTYSDVAPVLLVRGRKALQAAFPEAELRFQRVDIDRPLGGQRIEPSSFDLIVAVNTLHVARDLLASLGELRGALAPDGLLVLGEAVRPRPQDPLAFEFVFQLTEAFQRWEPVPGLREEPGFLPWERWPPLLERAGFTNVTTVPGDMAAAVRACPPYSLCALVARP